MARLFDISLRQKDDGSWTLAAFKALLPNDTEVNVECPEQGKINVTLDTDDATVQRIMEFLRSIGGSYTP